MFSSIIIPTIGRNTLSRAVSSALGQSFARGELEVIVVNDSGAPLAAAPWQRDERVQVIDTMRRERSVARNAGAAVAAGQYLAFLDDDDWLLPGALEELCSLAGRAPDAAWLYGAIRVVDSTGNVLAEVNSGMEGHCSAQVIGGAWVPLQSSLIRSEAFFSAGGFDPHICGTEDQDLCRRIALHGRLANTPVAIACLDRGESWATSTNYRRAAEDTRISRDSVLNQSGAFSRLLASATSSYWRGRVVHVYSSAVLFNWRRRSFAKVASRALSCVIAVLLSGRHIVTEPFWEAVKADHPPDTLHHVTLSLERASSHHS